MKSNFSRLSVAVLVSTTLMSTLTPTPSHAATYEGTVNTAILNVRSTSSTTASIVGKLTKGSTVKVYATNNNWTQIEYNGQKRYVASDYVTIKSTIAKTSTVTYKANALVNLRAAMTTSSKVVTTVPKGATVTYLSTHGATGSWLKVSYNGKTGYVAQRYFTKTGGQPVTSQATTTHLTKTSTPVYASTSTSARILVTLPKQAKVTLVSTHGATGSWAKISYNGTSGYVAMRNLQTAVTTSPKTLYTSKTTTLYDSTSTSRKALQTLALGTSVSQLETVGATGSWSKVTVGSRTGYIPTRDLTTKNVEAVTPYYAQRAVTLYSSMSTSKQAIQSIPVGAKVDRLSVHGATGSWFQVRYANQTGYVVARDFSSTPPATSTEQYGNEVDVRITVAGNGPLNVRKEPNASSAKMGELSSGTVLRVKPVLTTSWARITSGSFAGHYIHTDYMAPVVTPPPVAGIEKKIVYSSYPLSLATMVTTQYNQIAQTDAHINKPGYLPRSWVKVEGNVGTIVNHKMQTASNVGTPLRTSPSTSAASLITVPARVTFDYLERQTVGSTVWYKAQYGSMIGYVPATAVVGEASLFSRDSLSSHAFGQINPGEKVTILGQVGNYYTALYKRPAGHNIRIFDNVWRRASREEIQSYADPTQVDANSRAFYQFLDLSKPAGTKATSLNNLLVNKGTLTGQGQAFINAANQYSLNEVYLLAHALHETGNGLSRLASGVPVDKDGNALINSAGTRIYPDRPVAATVYNMYGIQATDSNPLGNGAKFAFEQKWFTPEAAIVGGGYWISQSYINHPTHKQNTLYKMRFNPASPGVHQYATNVAWPYHQTAKIYEFYQTLDAYSIQFDVPKFQ